MGFEHYGFSFFFVGEKKKAGEYFLAFPFPLDCFGAEIHFTFDSLHAEKDKKEFFARRILFVAQR